MGVRPAPRAGAGPTVIAAGLVVLVIGLGWLNHSGQSGDGNTPFARDVSQAIERAEAVGEIPGSEPARPSQLDGAEIANSGSAPRRTTSTTVVIDPETGLRITVTLPAESAAAGPPSTSGGSGTTGSETTEGSGGGSGSGGSTPGTSGDGGSGTTSPPSSANPPSTSPPATDPPATDPPTTDPPTTDPPTTDPPTTEPSPGLIGGLLDGVLGLLGL